MGSFVYHSLFIDGIIYLCASDNALDIVTPSAFLKNVSDIFLKNPLMSQEHFSPSNAIAADFQQVLGKYMMKYNKNQGDSSISTLRSQVTDVKIIMTQNINKILESEERLNSFTDRTNDLHTTTGREKHRFEEHLSVVSHTRPDQGSNPQPRPKTHKKQERFLGRYCGNTSKRL
uniref:Vesicle-associated membrane protein 7 n=1 Tax=Myotis myotis TaxID=51298 RepID=A0A7J8AMA0_MYOMY|nr:hypothetical protein mMyoMyo1_007876 [Myotis myotis]